MKKTWLVVAVAVVLSAVAFTPLPERIARWVSGEPGSSHVCSANAPKADMSFTLKDMYGKEVKLSDLKGKVVMLNFWATWCGPCLMEIPWFVELQDTYHSQGFRAIGISVDDAPDALVRFAREYKVNYPLLVGKDRNDVEKAFGPIFAVPITVLIGRDGTLCMKHIGPVSKAQFESEIKALL